MVIFATIEVILFAWVFGMDNAWGEIHKGADMVIPRIYKYIIKYITPLFLFCILGMWFWQQWLPVIGMKNVSAADRLYVLGTRLGLLAMFLVLAVMVNRAWKRKKTRA